MNGYDATAGDHRATNAEGLHGVYVTRRRRKRERDLGICCTDGSCAACEGEAEARKAEREDR